MNLLVKFIARVYSLKMIYTASVSD